ncbi:helix-turn-helix transcriptional regulator [Tsukamurella spumae]|uniref:helix-turn-helix transcriptional regulator n=1 Tax=Tsukamurella spumae TaxID=44753 RepID=UPI001FEA8DA0|nr:AraC family transcriptional regulator [Tsukamurella spumae]
MGTATATAMVTAGGRDWLVPPGYGLWIPGNIEHSGEILRRGEGFVLVFAADRSPVDWQEPTGVIVGPLLRELIGHLQQAEHDDPTRPAAESLLLTLLRPAPSHDLRLVMPTDPRIRPIAEHLVADPADDRGVEAWADEVHVGPRTVSRLFAAETGLPFGQWRTHARVHAAIGLLAGGAPVGTVARAVGYRKTSAFITAFRRVTGHTPGTYRDVKRPGAASITSR